MASTPPTPAAPAAASTTPTPDLSTAMLGLAERMAASDTGRLVGRVAALGAALGFWANFGPTVKAIPVVADTRRAARQVPVFGFLIFGAGLSALAVYGDFFWLHLVAFGLAATVCAMRGLRVGLATAAAEWGLTGSSRLPVTEALARGLGSALFLLGWWNLLAPFLRFHDHPVAAAGFSFAVVLFILRKEFVSASLKAEPFFKRSAALVAAPCFVALVWWAAAPHLTAAKTAIAGAPAGTTLADVAVAAQAAAAERTALTATAAARAAYHVADLSWPRGRRVEVAVPAAGHVNASVKLANDMPVRVTATGPAGSAVMVGLWDRAAASYALQKRVEVGTPANIRHLGLNVVEVWVDGGGAPTRVLFDRGVR